MRSSPKFYLKLKNYLFLPSLLITTGIVVYIVTTIIQKHAEKEGCLQGPLKADDVFVTGVLKERFLDPPSTLPYNLSTDKLYHSYSHSYAYPLIKKWVKGIFPPNYQGFFIEAGALDGEYLSNTLWLERERNWNGLLIEPDKRSFKNLVFKHRKAWMSNTCLSTNTFPKQINFISVSQNKIYLGDLHMNYRGNGHEIGYTLPPSYKEMVDTFEKNFERVQCFPLYSFLIALNRTHIDFLSLDIQGAEEDVLRTIPFDVIDITAMVIEISDPQSTIVPYLESKGYKLMNIYFEDHFFLRDNFGISKNEQIDIH